MLRLPVEDPYFYNMSYLTNNQTYLSAGGIGGPINRFSLYGQRVMPLPNPSIRMGRDID